MKETDSFPNQLGEENTFDSIKYDAIDDIEDYFRTSALTRVSILPRWIIS
ncbi:MAG: hypothetical protein IBJ00_02455 [Alphaproteobacteria bacterium]|nr:hypothetical protein [Alphaproteobacteria bacterium]